MDEKLQELIDLAGRLGQTRERGKILRIMNEIKCSNEIGTYVYINDLFSYLDDLDLEEKEKTNA